jgi:predicted Rossmann fold nucleotide-binding protein DprA/Smf involved in DNA uptake
VFELMQSEMNLTPDTQAVLLLCGELGQRGSAALKPLGLRQYNAVALWLKTEGLRPADLLDAEGRAKLSGLQTAEVDAGRAGPLLDRGAALALMVERWERSGLWVVSRSDDAYPERLKRYLGSAAPPLLYGVGSQALLDRGGLAVVGSRDRSEEDGEYASRVGEQCARRGIAIISGAAKGVDRDAMTGALEAGGWALGVLAEGLAKTATSGQYRSGLMSERLTLISPYDPDSRWFAYTAMERNKLLYGLSDAALVVASSDDSGGTWSGAVEALKAGKVKVFVKSAGAVAPGNPKLIRMGGIAFPPEPWDDLASLLTPPEKMSGQLFEPVEAEAAAAAGPAVAPVDSPVAAGEAVAESASPPEAAAAEPEPAGSDAYALVIDTVVALLKEPRTDAWIAGKLHVRTAQMKDWLNRGVAEGRISKLKKPVRYVVPAKSLFSAVD